MGVAMYWIVVAAVVILGAVMPQHGKQRSAYIAAMTVLHTLVSGLRYRFLTGDMMTYERVFLTSRNLSFFDDFLQIGRAHV